VLRAKRLPAYRVYLIYSCSMALLFAMLSTVSGVYQVKVAHFDPLQLVLVGTALEASTFLFEVPTGIVADVYSRRLSIIVGVVLTGAGFLLWGAFSLFWTIVAAQVVWGLGYTFISGATEAWIADEVGEERSGAAFLRGAQAGQVGALAGIVLSVVFASVNLHLPLLLSGGLLLTLAAFMALCMPENGFAPVPAGDRNTWQRMGHTFRSGLRQVRGRPVLITILAIAAIYGAASEGYDRLNVALLLNTIGLPSLGRFDPVIWFAVISIGGILLSLVAAEVVRRRMDTTDHVAVAGLLSASNALLIATVMLFALAGNFAVAISALWATQLLRRTNGPLQTIWINQNLEPSVRATVFSLAGQADALGQICGGPLLGVIAAAVSVRAGIGVAALFLVPALVLYARTLRRPRITAVSGVE
jgi:DHA3 family tetracycline resistance protein-like MFS transporter